VIHDVRKHFAEFRERYLFLHIEKYTPIALQLPPMPSESLLLHADAVIE
jgi:hypothetical protein